MQESDWKETFLKLFISEVDENYDKALELKRTNIPKKLYRYRSIDSDEKMEFTKGEIITGEIYFADIKTFNDPFDSSSLLSNSVSSSYLNTPIIKDRWSISLKDHFSEQEFKKVFESENWYNKILELVAYKEQRSIGINKDDLKNANEYTLMKKLEGLNKHYNSIFHKRFRIACFTESNANLPMWAHYANQHRGICLEYDLDNIDSICNINRLFPVYYVEKLQDIVMFNSNSHNLVPILVWYYIIMHKLSDWSYEKEWRLIHNIDGLYINNKSFFNIPSKIYLGYSIDEKKEKEIREIAKLCKIPVVKMNITQYGLSDTEL